MSTTKNLWIWGIEGRMGRMIAKLAASRSFYLSGGNGPENVYEEPNPETGELGSPSIYDDSSLQTKLADIDCIIEFSTPEGNQALLSLLQKQGGPWLKHKSILVGTTGLSDAQLAEWQELSEAYALRLLIAPNTSLGILLLLKLSQQAAAILQPEGFDIEMVESHHRQKLDAPSGTAKFLAQAIAEQQMLRVVTNRTAKREADELGVVAIRGGNIFGEHSLFMIGEQEEIVLSHRAFSRELFAQGALKLCGWLAGQDPGSYVLQDIELDSLRQS